MFNGCVEFKKPCKGNGKQILATKITTVITEFYCFDKLCKITLRSVFYAKEMKKNILSYNKVADKNKIALYYDICKKYNQKNELIATTHKINNLRYMERSMKNIFNNKEVNSSVIENLMNKKMFMQTQ